MKKQYTKGHIIWLYFIYICYLKYQWGHFGKILSRGLKIVYSNNSRGIQGFDKVDGATNFMHFDILLVNLDTSIQDAHFRH